VLPLDNISPDSNDEYFADGLHRGMITVLSHVDGLEVIAGHPLLRYKGGAKQVAMIRERVCASVRPRRKREEGGEQGEGHSPAD